MRARFFTTIFSIALVAGVIVSAIHFTFFKLERMRLVDEHLEAIASSIYTSDLSHASLDDLEETEDIVADALGTDQITTTVTIMDPDGKILYQNQNARLLEMEPAPLSPAQMTVTAGTHHIRLVNLVHPKTKRHLQVGLLLDQSVVRWRGFTRSVFLMMLALGGLLLLMSVMLTGLLLRPLRDLTSFLTHYTESLTTTGIRIPFPATLIRPHRGILGKKDEFTELVTAFEELSSRLEKRFALNRDTAAQMAHELKTPLTVISNNLEMLQRKNRNEDIDLLKDSQTEVSHLNELISSFLDWSRTEADTIEKDVHAIHVRNVLESLVKRLNPHFANRIELKCESDPLVFGNPVFVELAFKNLIENALIHTTRHVSVELSPRSVFIIDSGAGLPPEVEKRLGQPFNTDRNQSRISGRPVSTGLGLAWVMTISRMNRWQIHFVKKASGHQVEIYFPNE